MAEEVVVADQQIQVAASNTDGAAVTTTETPAAPPEITDEQMIAFLEKKGVKVDNFETLKQKVEYVAPAPPPTDEEKTKAELSIEKKLLDKHLSRGGTVEQFAILKQTAAADAKELGYKKIHEDLKKEGFTDDQAAQIVKKMTFEVTAEELEELEEDQKEILKKQAAFGVKKQTNRGEYLKKTASSYFDSLRNEVAEDDAEKTKMEQHSSKVEDAIKNYQRKETLNLGQLDGVDLPPIDFEVSDAALTEASAILKDPAKLQQHLYTKDGDLNLDFILPHIIKSLSMSDAVKKSYLTGGTRQVEAFQAKFGSAIPSLGGPSKPQTGDKKIVRVGKPVLGNPTVNN